MKWRDSVPIALMAAALCALSPWALPVGAVPISLATLGVYFCVGLLGLRGGTLAVGVYLLLGAVGVPVFAGFIGGLPHLLGPTGGYLLGYLPCAVAAGVLMRVIPDGKWFPLWLGVGTLVLYALGTAWYMWQTAVPLWAALATCVLPFVAADVVKIAVATAVILPLRGRIDRVLRPRV